MPFRYLALTLLATLVLAPTFKSAADQEDCLAFTCESNNSPLNGGQLGTPLPSQTTSVPGTSSFLVTSTISSSPAFGVDFLPSELNSSPLFPPSSQAWNGTSLRLENSSITTLNLLGIPF